MHLRGQGHGGRFMVVLALVFATAAWSDLALAQDVSGAIDVDFLLSYYDQDGEHSAVTGGTGTERQQVLSPVVVIGWQISDNWRVDVNNGVDGISSASVDAMDGRSGASKQDARIHLDLAATRKLEAHDVSLFGGFSREFDYVSVHLGLGWTGNFNQRNTTLSTSLNHYEDTLTLYDINGADRGSDTRRTTSFGASFTQVLSKRALTSISADATLQRGFLGTPFHEVVFSNPETPVQAERLPDERQRFALGWRTNVTFSHGYVQRFFYRFYVDDWGIVSHAVELEPHFRIGQGRDRWIYPIVRYHMQSGADYFAPTGGHDPNEEFYTSDWDLAETKTVKVGLGFRTAAAAGTSWALGFRAVDMRLAWFDRDDGLRGALFTIGLHWRRDG